MVFEKGFEGETGEGGGGRTGLLPVETANKKVSRRIVAKDFSHFLHSPPIIIRPGGKRGWRKGATVEENSSGREPRD